MNTLQESKMPSGNLYQKNIYLFHNLAYNQVKVLKEKYRQIKKKTHFCTSISFTIVSSIL